MTTFKKKISLIFGLVIATMVGLTAQDFQGIAIYQSARKMNGFNIQAEGMTPAMQKQLQEQMKKQFQKEYELKFNLTESLWYEPASLDGGPATAQAGGMVIQMSTGGGLTYKNTAKKLYMQETEMFSKPFLIKDELESREWEITGETKKIGNYQAQKAILTDIRESRTISFSSTNDSEEDGEKQVTMDTTKIEAWFTSQIPVSQGPDDFWGLPGLILEVNDGTTSYVCTKVVLNPEDGVEIKKPNKGKKVTREEFRTEMDAKTEEMMKKFEQGGRGGGHTIRIRTGGGE